jgi:hypothetical protein
MMDLIPEPSEKDYIYTSKDNSNILKRSVHDGDDNVFSPRMALRPVHFDGPQEGDRTRRKNQVSENMG